MAATVRRLLTKEQLIYLQLDGKAFDSCPLGRDEEIADSIQRSPKTDVLAVGNGTVLFVEFKSARRKVESQLKQLAHIEELGGQRSRDHARNTRVQGNPDSCRSRGRHAGSGQQWKRFLKAIRP